MLKFLRALRILRVWKQSQKYPPSPRANGERVGALSLSPNRGRGNF